MAKTLSASIERVRLDTATNVETLETTGARAVPARRIVDCTDDLELMAVVLVLHSCCEQGTARAPGALC